MRRIIGTIGATLAIVALVAGSAGPANGQSAIEHALMSSFVASGNGGPELEAAGLASRLGAEPGLESGRNAGTGSPRAPSSTARARTRRSVRSPVPPR